MSQASPKCPECFAQMKPLFQSFFCPNDCDTPEGQARLKAARDKIDYANIKKADPFSGQHFFYNYIPVVAP